MPQLSLNFTDSPLPQQSLWESLNHQQQQLLIEALARLMAKAAALPETPKEAAND